MTSEKQINSAIDWSEAYRTYAPQLKTHFARSVGPHRAEDIVQETFERAMVAKFEPGTNMRAWLYRIGTNRLIDQVRAAGRRPSEESLFTDEGAVSQNVERATSVTPAQDTVPEVMAAQAVLDTLSSEYRGVVEGAIADLSYNDIADREGIPFGTVQSRLSRARRQVAELLPTFLGQEVEIDKQVA